MPFFNEECPVVITPVALSHIQNVIKQKGLDTNLYGLRVGIRGGGCGGAAPMLGFDTAKDSDQCYVLENFSVYIEKKHVMYVIGLEIDFEENEEISGFVFNNPNENALSQ